MKTRLASLATILVVVVTCGVNSRAVAKTYYVSTSGDDSADGLAEATAWRTITRAANVTVAGDTVKIKAGKYNNEHAVISNRSGTKASPIVFEGYGGTPELDGLDGTGNGIVVNSLKYIELKNLKVTRYLKGVVLEKSEYVTLDGLTATVMGNRVGPYSGWGIQLQGSHHCIVRNCSVTDAGAVNFQIWYSNYNLIENCTSYGIRTDDATDYYIVVGYSHDNIIRNCTSHNKHPKARVHPGHGIGIKDLYHKGTYSGIHSYNNKIINCVARGNGELFFAAHPVHHNEFINCTAYYGDSWSGWTKAFRVRDGAHHNTFRNCRAVGTACGVYLDRTTESPGVAVQRDNVFLNCIFEGMTRSGIYFNSTKNNVFKNCVFVRNPALFAARELNNGNIIANSIICDVPAYRLNWQSRHPDPWVEKHLPNPAPDPDVADDLTVTYSDFWNTNFNKPAGRGNMSKDPLFVAPTKGDYYLRSRAGRWDPKKKKFVKDTVHSPGIDAGDPKAEWKSEPAPNGGRVNIGAYGNTPEASKSAGATPARKGR